VTIYSLEGRRNIFSSVMCCYCAQSCAHTQTIIMQ